MLHRIFGFEHFKKISRTILPEHVAMAIRQQPLYQGNDLMMMESDLDEVAFRVYTTKEKKPITILPVVKTDYVIDVENKSINEWENINNHEAVITGSGRDTFGITWFATDYAMNRELYRSQKKHNVAISGIIFVLDKHTHEEVSSFSNDFTGYFPNKDLSKKGGFDFVGILEDYKAHRLPDSYILKVKLINHPDSADFFTIDMFVTQKNMRFEGLEKGMKLTGVFQMQGQLVR